MTNEQYNKILEMMGFIHSSILQLSTQVTSLEKRMDSLEVRMDTLEQYCKESHIEIQRSIEEYMQDEHARFRAQLKNHEGRLGSIEQLAF
ncbi:MAG: hypothetical protein WAQ27_03120 [Candidatus Microsaccharimonas sp.]